MIILSYSFTFSIWCLGLLGCCSFFKGACTPVCYVRRHVSGLGKKMSYFPIKRLSYFAVLVVPVYWHPVDKKRVRGYNVCKPCFGEIAILMLALASTVESVSICSQLVGNDNTGYLRTKNAFGHSCSILI